MVFSDILGKISIFLSGLSKLESNNVLNDKVALNVKEYIQLVY